MTLDEKIAAGFALFWTKVVLLTMLVAGRSGSSMRDALSGANFLSSDRNPRPWLGADTDRQALSAAPREGRNSAISYRFLDFHYLMNRFFIQFLRRDPGKFSSSLKMYREVNLLNWHISKLWEKREIKSTDRLVNIRISDIAGTARSPRCVARPNDGRSRENGGFVARSLERKRKIGITPNPFVSNEVEKSTIDRPWRFSTSPCG